MTKAFADRRIWVAGSALVAVLLVAASWFLFISPKLSDADQLNTQAGSIQDQNALTASKVAKLKREYANLGVYKTDLAERMAALPSGSGLPAFTTETVRLAAANGVQLTSINVSNPTPATAAASTVAPSTGSTGGTTSDSSSSTTQTDSGSGSGTTGQTTSTAAAPGQFMIPVTLLTSGTLSHQLAFLNAVEHGQRDALITSNQFTVTAASRVASVDANTTMTTQLSVFSAPMSAAQLAVLRKLLSAAG